MNVRVIPHKRDQRKWAIDYRCPTTRKRKYESFPTKGEAVARKKELEGQHATGKYRPVHRRSWAEFVAKYRETILAHKPRGTRVAYDEAIRHFERLVAPEIVASIGPEHLDRFATARGGETKGKVNKKRLSTNTVNKGLRHLRAVLRTAHRWGWLPILPEVKLLKTPDREPRAIPSKVFEAILTTARGIDPRLLSPARERMLRQATSGTRGNPHNPPGSQWWVAFLSVAYLAGLRWSEILGLRWGDVRLTGKPSIRIRAEISKTARDQSVPMSATLADRLTAYMSTASDVRDDAIIFPHRCHDNTLSATWERLQTWAKVDPPFRFHDLRVSFCTNLVASGTEAASLMKLARHRSLSTTIRYYRGKTDEADRGALDRMEAALAAAQKGEADASGESGEQFGERVLHN